jgi:hypothetical protein
MTDNTETNLSSAEAAAAKKRKRLKYAGIGIAVLLVVVWLSDGPSSEDSSSSTPPPATTAPPSTTEAPATTAAPSTTEAPAPSTTAEATQDELLQLVALGMMWGNNEEQVCELLTEGISLGVYQDEEDAALTYTAMWGNDLEKNSDTKPYDRTLVGLYELILEDCFGL